MKASIKQLAALAAISATAGLTGVSMAEFHGRAKVILMHGASGGAGQTVTAKLQHRNGTDAWEDIDGAAFAAITNASGGTQVIEVDADGFKDDVRLHCTVSSGATATLAAAVIGQKQYGI
ncbi:hypothetical protein [Paracoccus aestuariivivens]|uniref:Uncharacterized protein n=1 Tax=Paracoccus aestuariivivens TaxID=1820333 RepID=A0A6L6JDR7_9RHOB|nr:hypothetical protein [Paracoccus aestuariivivens]MTH78747.1 hypothetical protein [Paracoccus aestuariivivens]